MKKSKHQSNNTAIIISTIISRVLDPFLVLLGVTGWMIWESTLADTSKYLFLGIVLGVMIIPPVLLLIWAIAKKHIDNWDISDRKQRPLALIVIFLLGFINIIIVQTFGDRILTDLFIMYQLWMAGFMAITFLWKISGHTGTLALATGLIVLRAGVEWWPILLLVVLLGFARVIRKNHTPAQAIAGAFYSWSILLIARSIGLV
jgi:hypothetical protein